ncbi:MAG: ferrous iron transport protein A [Clostridiaceae bacterium]|jgi:ferrous iron transport protein A|nr:ferrous iron transport protein A [Clostridiaceae bacterium]
MFLHQLAIDQCARIVRVHGKGELRRRLLDMGLTPGTTVKLVRMAPLGDPMQLCLRGYKLSLRREAARDIEVEPLSACAGTCTVACAHRTPGCWQGDTDCVRRERGSGRRWRWRRKN